MFGQREVWGDFFPIGEPDAAGVQPVCTLVTGDHPLAVVRDCAAHTPASRTCGHGNQSVRQAARPWCARDAGRQRERCTHLTIAGSFGVICLESTPLPIDS
jgi:hypothetical protein